MGVSEPTGCVMCGVGGRCLTERYGYWHPDHVFIQCLSFSCALAFFPPFHTCAHQNWHRVKDGWGWHHPHWHVNRVTDLGSAANSGKEQQNDSRLGIAGAKAQLETSAGTKWRGCRESGRLGGCWPGRHLSFSILVSVFFLLILPCLFSFSFSVICLLILNSALQACMDQDLKPKEFRLFHRLCCGLR